MKKVFILCLAVALSFANLVTVFAADSFVNSPSINSAPIVIEYNSTFDECEADIVVTPYSNRNSLPGEHLANIESAYDLIIKSDDIATLNEDLKKLAESLGEAGDSLAVSDLFNVHFEGCVDHKNHRIYSLVLQMETLDNFVGLLCRGLDGEFVLVKDVKLSDNPKQRAAQAAKYLSFTGEYYGAFAVVVDTDVPVVEPEDPDTPVTGDTIMLYAVLMVVSFGAMVAVAVKMRKQRV